jgi:hypothetical protein
VSELTTELTAIIPIPAHDSQQGAHQLFTDRIRVAQTYISWYRRKKDGKKRFSLLLRIAALGLLGAGGIAPLLGLIGPTKLSGFGYPLLAAGGGIFLLDNMLGISTSWMRFMATAVKLEAALDEFRVKWASIELLNGQFSDSSKIVEPLTELASEFTSTIHKLVDEETRGWITEFSSSSNELKALLQPNKKL